MIKLIVCDLDGTVLDDHKEVDSKLKDVVNKLEERGIMFTIASGRNEEILTKYVDYFELKHPYITNNGGNIYQNHKCLSNDCLPSEYNNTIARKLHANNLPFRLFALEEFVGYSDSEFFEERQSYFKPYLVDYDPNMDLSNHHVYKITFDLISKMDYAQKLGEEILKDCPNLSYSKGDITAYCFNSLTATKGQALLKVCEYLNIDKSEVMAFGDNGNDYSMIKLAGIGVAMGNADEEIKEISDYICGDNNHNGISNFLIDYFKL